VCLPIKIFLESGSILYPKTIESSAMLPSATSTGETNDTAYFPERQPDTTDASGFQSEPLQLGTRTDVQDQIETQQFHFTGSGSEYFRIWIVNLCLTIATLGIYSAWAKVRRLQYFDRNTVLANAVFNFHGNPVAIFKGRMLALVLLIAYHYAFGFSKYFGIVVITVLFVSMPWFLRSALRFRLRNTSYRGLRFQFTGSIGGAYLSYAPTMLILLFPATFVALMPQQTGKLFAMMSLLYACWPFMHGQMKVYQHSHLQYGAQHSGYDGNSSSLFKPYFIAFLFGLGMVAVAAALIGAAIGIWAVVHKNAENQSMLPLYVSAAVLMTLYIYGVYLIVGPYLQVRIWNRVWNQTHFPGLRIRSDLRVWPYLRLQTVNVILTVLTLGLFRPFAVVRTYRYRLSQMSVTSTSLDELFQHEQVSDANASGDSAADFLGIDLSW
jgi:uncharacterized membrane protein YjgN (DUF898 family)